MLCAELVIGTNGRAIKQRPRASKYDSEIAVNRRKLHEPSFHNASGSYATAGGSADRIHAAVLAQSRTVVPLLQTLRLNFSDQLTSCAGFVR